MDGREIMEKAQPVEVQKGMKERYREYHNPSWLDQGVVGRCGRAWK